MEIGCRYEEFLSDNSIVVVLAQCLERQLIQKIVWCAKMVPGNKTKQVETYSGKVLT